MIEAQEVKRLWYNLLSVLMPNLENDFRSLDIVISKQYSNETQSVKDALQLLDARGLCVLRKDETDTISSHFSSELVNGLTPEHHSDLPMVNTRIPIANFDHLTPGDEALVLVLGGTHVRSAVVSIDENRKPRIKLNGALGKQFYKEAMIKQREFSTPNDFYDAMLNPVRPFLEELRPQAIGIIYAFGGNAVEGNHGVDIKPFEIMGKKFTVPGINDKPVGEAVFQRPALYPLKVVKNRVVTNDIAPVCIAGEANIGGIIATGFNIGLRINGFYYNTEAGGHFKWMPIHYYANLVDAQSNNPGHALLEKQLSGGYLGLTLSQALHDLRENGYVNIQVPNNLGSEAVTDIVNGQGLFVEGQDNQSRRIVLDTASRIGFRAAQGMGTLIGSAIRTFPQEFPEENVRVPIEGPLFWSMRGFGHIARNYASHYADKNVTFMRVPHADILGAGTAALLS